MDKPDKLINWKCQNCHQLRCICRPAAVTGFWWLLLRSVLRRDPTRGFARNRLSFLRQTERDIYRRKGSAFWQRSSEAPLPTSEGWRDYRKETTTED